MLVILAILLFASAAPPLRVGSGRDAHGCITSAGYSWCKYESRCVRVWELPVDSPCRQKQDKCANKICEKGWKCDSLKGDCVAVSCEAASACSREEICVPAEKQCVRAPCPQFDCVVPKVCIFDCVIGFKCSPITGKCEPDGSELVCVKQLPDVFCGRGGQRCPSGFDCVIDPADRFAVCCPTQELCANKICERGYECDPDRGVCVAMSCEAKDACTRGQYCMPAEKRCIRAPCPQYDCAEPEPEPEPNPPQLQCEAPKVFRTCGSACPPTCDKPNPTICTRQCVIGCFCPDGLFLDQNGRCVTLDQCNGPISCGPCEPGYACGVTSEGKCVPVNCQAPTACPLAKICKEDILAKCIPDEPCRNFTCHSRDEERCVICPQIIPRCSLTCVNCTMTPQTCESCASAECLLDCALVDCLPLSCPAYQQVTPAGSCCPVCESECAVKECGPRPGLPNIICSDGSIGEPTGRCIRTEQGTCGWEIRACPADQCANKVCGKGYECNSADGKCVAVSCDAATACPLAQRCVRTQKVCKRAPCPQFECVDREPECDEGKVWRDCGSACPPTCDDSGPKACILRCVSGCFCPDGKVLNKDGNCVTREECPSICSSIACSRGTSCNPRTGACESVVDNECALPLCAIGTFCNPATGQCEAASMCKKLCIIGFVCNPFTGECEPEANQNQCLNPLDNVNCGRGGQTCPYGYECLIDPADRFAVCCPTNDCTLAECGPRPESPNVICDNGSVGGPTGKCIRNKQGTCGWEIRACPNKCVNKVCERGYECDSRNGSCVAVSCEAADACPAYQQCVPSRRVCVRAPCVQFTCVERQCEDGKVFKECGSACPPTCEKPDPQVCTRQCVAACFCPQGQVLDRNGKCVTPNKCSGKSDRDKGDDDDMSKDDNKNDLCKRVKCPGKVCNPHTGACEKVCRANCKGKTCGPDGCGGSCGSCKNKKTCPLGRCVKN